MYNNTTTKETPTMNVYNTHSVSSSNVSISIATTQATIGMGLATVQATLALLEAQMTSPEEKLVEAYNKRIQQLNNI